MNNDILYTQAPTLWVWFNQQTGGLIMTLHELKIGSLFRYNDSVYELLKADDQDNYEVICKARPRQDGSLYAVTMGQEENFNPYASIEPGTLEVVFQPAKRS